MEEETNNYFWKRNLVQVSFLDYAYFGNNARIWQVIYYYYIKYIDYIFTLVFMPITQREWGVESPIHNFFPDVFKNHIDKGNAVFQVTQELAYKWKNWVIDIKDPTSWNALILEAWKEVILDGGCTRMKQDVNNPDLREVVFISGTYEGKEIEIIVKGLDIVSYLNPSDFPDSITKQVDAGKNDIATTL